MITTSKGDDFLNVIRSKFKIVSTDFEDVKIDAIDIDFSTGVIAKSNFIRVGNDAYSNRRTKTLRRGSDR